MLRETFEALLLLSAVVVGFGQEVVAGCLGEPFEHSTFQSLTPACTDFHDIQYALLYCSHLGGTRSFLVWILAVLHTASLSTLTHLPVHS